ncbi:glycosyltransferase EpsJ [Paenibacillus castaneae]|uniref:glycosyltransferase family 2 protein n=1 Tax=Paenibacillus castaneae TaxID=474957 RepID=UPI001FB86AA4|nr:glycosyltransferase [Paenibacillus castaneae]NIK78208.1 glycosyltransferase EpsJ [Paenibacillus castaneae]
MSISVVVPMYKAEKYLHSCIASILKQTFQNFEILLVNDGSPDKCGEIADEYCNQDSRIKVFHKQNGGISSARNAGIDAATGEYIVFIDSDDQISDNYLQRLYFTAKNNNCDAVVCGYREVATDKQVVPGFKLHQIRNGKEFVLSSTHVHSRNDLCFTWRILFRLDMIKKNNIRFNENLFVGEDTIFNLEYFLEAERMYCIPDALYYYTVNNPNSIMKTLYKPNLESSLILQYGIRKQLSEKFGLMDNNSYRGDMAYYYITSIYRMLVRNLISSPETDKMTGLARILNYEMFTDSFNEIGFSYKCGNVKEYIYYLALRYKLMPLLKREFHQSVAN